MGHSDDELYQLKQHKVETRWHEAIKPKITKKDIKPNESGMGWWVLVAHISPSFLGIL